MKKILSFTLAVLMLLSLGVFCGCDNTDKGNTDASGATADESPLAGRWQVVSTDDEIEWLLNSEETLHITQAYSGQRFTTVCRYAYDEQTGDFEYTGLSESVSFKGTVTLEGSIMHVKSTDGTKTVILQRKDS